MRLQILLEVVIIVDMFFLEHLDETLKQMIKIENLSKTIDKKVILKDITMSFEKGKIYGIVGRNGCGKTMLLRAICGLIAPTGGTIEKAPNLTFGALIESPGFMFEQSGLFNLQYLASLNKKIGTSEILSLLKEFGLYEARNKSVKKYSLGMQQKLGIIQAIMESPDVIVLDEPFNALDDNSLEFVKQKLVNIKEAGNATIIIASHDITIIEELCDEIIHMSNL